jgi:hypothetical protein
MTAPAASPPPDLADDAVAGCLANLLEAADAADILGLGTGPVRDAHADASRRLGFPSDAYVLALVGGTGVGKSSLLNALAGVTVSAASVRRPTTSEPIAWVPTREREGLAPLLDWLEVRDVREHDASGLASVAILDLPDMDSVEAAHRDRVEAVLPKVDAVAWVTDLEKYHDAVLHDAFLRAWVPRLDRQVVVVNKADRLDGDDRGRVRRDLEADFARRLVSGHGTPVPVLMTSALRPAVDRASPGDAAAGPSIDELRAWLADGAASKAVVRDRIRKTLVDFARGLAREAGMEPGDAVSPFLAPSARERAIEETTRNVLRVVDLAGLEAHAVGATRARARARGTGPIGRVTSLVYQASGRATRAADPEGFLMRWRERGSLTPAVETLRRALSSPLAGAGPAVRPALAGALEPGQLREGLERAVDRAIGGLDRLEAPSSRWWSVIGLLQTLATVGIALSAAWVVVWILARPPVDSIQVPVVGAVPMPFAALVVSALAGYLLARVLGLHAGWVGRRWARGVRERVAGSVRAEVTGRGLGPLDRLEAARGRLAAATASLLRECGEH